MFLSLRMLAAIFLAGKPGLPVWLFLSQISSSYDKFALYHPELRYTILNQILNYELMNMLGLSESNTVTD